MLFGELTWDGSADETVEGAFRQTYGDPLVWAVLRDAVIDSEFVRRLGLRYALFVRSSTSGPSMVEVDAGDIALRDPDSVDGPQRDGCFTVRWRGAHRLDDFWASRSEELEALAALLQRHEIWSMQQHT